MKWLTRDTVRAPHLLLCLTEAEYARAVRHCAVRSPEGWIDEERQTACVHTWEKDGSLVCVVCLASDSLEQDPVAVILTLVHEAVHVFQRLCDSIGENHPSREFEAYSIERIAEALICEYQRRYQGGKP
ncbi:hypothetical protein LMG2828_04716 [Achromobacter piechaudii]|uniref:hypothetical protein n=1 Tax=Achromobacter piechaudii TaxID=72556 RepID=UPI00146866C1|nr:hypothetical protein [Achromobacter piechaudii]CAB3905298.1 hypothetical protein LMG2828_04716 [Achromobacter piechaudii]